MHIPSNIKLDSAIPCISQPPNGPPHTITATSHSYIPRIEFASSSVLDNQPTQSHPHPLKPLFFSLSLFTKRIRKRYSQHSIPTGRSETKNGASLFPTRASQTHSPPCNPSIGPKRAKGEYQKGTKRASPSHPDFRKKEETRYARPKNPCDSNLTAVASALSHHPETSLQRVKR